MKVNRNNEIPMYKREILRLLRLLWKQQDFMMWQQIYTVIHCFCKMKDEHCDIATEGRYR